MLERLDALRLIRYEDKSSRKFGYQLIHSYNNSNGNGELERIEASVREVRARVSADGNDYILEDVRVIITKDGTISEFSGSFRFVELDKIEEAVRVIMLERIEKESRVYRKIRLLQHVEIQDDTSSISERIIRRSFSIPPLTAQIRNQDIL